MENYSKFISQKRRSVKTPDQLITDGKPVFGTFESEFKVLNLLDCKKPTHLPNFLNKKKLTLWEAVEVSFKEGYLLIACIDMGLFGMAFHVFYNNTSKKVTYWSTKMKSKEVSIAPNLLNGSESKIDSDNASITFINNFEKGVATVDGHHEDKEAGKIHYHFSLEALSLPSVVSIPFGKNRPLYTEKQFFKANGSVTINGKEYQSDDLTTAIIDDHRGYYPYKTHFDWITAMGFTKEGKYQAINLTANQSIDPPNFNENLIWNEKSTSLLPEVTFTKSQKSSKFISNKLTPTTWEIKDKYDMVNLTFHIEGIYKDEENHFGIIRVKYYVLFGYLEGYVRNENGEKYEFDHLEAMAEDKTLHV